MGDWSHYSSHCLTAIIQLYCYSTRAQQVDASGVKHFTLAMVPSFALEGLATPPPPPSPRGGLASSAVDA